MAGSALLMDEFSHGRVCVVALAGRIDSTNAEELMARLKGALSNNPQPLLVDLSRVIYLTSAAFRALLVATHEAERRAVPFALCGASVQVRELFEMGGLLDAFTMYASREDAIGKLA
jgi:anti-sigma B factor antagonist